MKGHHLDSNIAANLSTLSDMLVSRRNELRAEVQASSAVRRAHEVGGEVEDWKDQAADRQQTEVLDAEALRDINELTRVEQALQRLQDGTYGQCIDCQVDIPVKRLLAQPAALRCAACQAAVERH
jgi:DnaK suppressor protein